MRTSTYLTHSPERLFYFAIVIIIIIVVIMTTIKMIIIIILHFNAAMSLRPTEADCNLIVIMIMKSWTL